MQLKATITLYLFALFLFTGIEAAAQTTVEGTVTSAADGEPLAGVSVVVKGTTIGSPTGNQGEYSVRVPEGNTILVFSFVGFKTQEVPIDGRSTIDIAMETDIQQLSDVVVVGFGTQSKTDLTGNVASVSSEELENIQVASIEQAIQGKAAGVFINSNNGKLGQAIQLRIRGTSSLTASAQPLYVIDGIPVTTESFSIVDNETNPIADLNFDDVESVEILKDASAAAIYGSRGSNGVILITTKSGRSGDTQFDLNYTVGTSEPAGEREFLNADQYLELFTEAFANSSSDGTENGTLFGLTRQELFDADIPGWDQGFNSDWQSAPYQDNITQTVQLKASGGNDQTQFYISGGADLLEGYSY